MDGLGRVSTLTYDGAGRLLRQEDPTGKAVAYKLDARGNRVETRRVPRPGSGLDATVETATYHPDWNKPTRVVDARGHATDLAYDNAGNLVSVTQPEVWDAVAGQAVQPVTRLEYDARGRVTAVVDPAGMRTAYVYSTATEVMTRMVADTGQGRLNLETRFEWDPVGNLARVVDPRGHASTATYDAARRQLSLSRPHGFYVEWAYDANGWVRELRQATWDEFGSEDPSPDPEWTRAVTSFAYTPDGLIASVTNPAGETTIYVHDLPGRVVKETDPLGRVSTTSYDQAGQKVEERRAVGTPLEQATARFTYHADGQVSEVIDPRGYALKHFYDGLGRLETEQHADNQSESYGYDAADNKVRDRRRDGTVATYGFDALGRMEWASVEGMRLRRLAHDLAGRPARVWEDVDGDGAWDAGEPGRATTHDTAGRLAAEEVHLPKPGGGTLAATVAFAHDAAGNRTGITLPGGLSAAYAHDALGRVVGLAVGGTTLKSWTWDPLGRPLSAGMAAGGTVGWRHDRAGRVTALSFGGGALGSLAYAYDAAGHLVREEGTDDLLPPLYAERTTYDAANPINGSPRVNGQVLAYDGRGNLAGDGVRSCATPWDETSAQAFPASGARTVRFPAGPVRA